MMMISDVRFGDYDVRCMRWSCTMYDLEIGDDVCFDDDDV